MQVREFDLRSLDKMLPCPFCGGEAELDTAQGYRAINGHFGNRVVVYCRDCGADQGTCVEDVPDIHPNEVIERWNKRTASDAQAERVRVLESALGELLRWCPAKRDEWSSRDAFEQFIIVRDTARAALRGEA